MKKPSTPAKASRRSSGRSRIAKAAETSATLETIDQIEPQTAKAAGVIALLKSWLADESGYDEQTWPKLKKALDRQRERAGARRLFDE